jgi:ketosteroid isomerase-like protein
MADRHEEFVARVRGCLEAFNREDFDAAVEIAHPEIELIRPGGLGSVIGADAMRAWMEPDALEDQQIEPLEFRVEGNKVLVHARTRSRGAGSGIEMDLATWSVWTMNDEDLATRVEYFLPHQKAEAFEAAGMRE